MQLQLLAEREGGAGREGREGRAAPLLPIGVIPVDQLCNFTKLEHYRWSSSISDAHRDKDCPPWREGKKRKTSNDWRRWQWRCAAGNRCKDAPKKITAWVCMCAAAAHVAEWEATSKQNTGL